MIRRISFDVTVADSFDYRRRFPRPEGKWWVDTFVIEFETNGRDAMKDAHQALDDFMNKTYPDKKYRSYYWEWK